MENKFITKIERANIFLIDCEKTIRHIIQDNNKVGELVETSEVSDFNLRQNMNLNLTNEEIAELACINMEILNNINKYKEFLKRGIK